MRSHSLWLTAPLNTRRSVPRLMPLNSVRTKPRRAVAAAWGRPAARPRPSWGTRWRAPCGSCRSTGASSSYLPRRGHCSDEGCMNNSLDTPTPGRMPPVRLTLTTPAGLQSIDALTRRRRIVAALNIVSYAAHAASGGTHSRHRRLDLGRYRPVRLLCVRHALDRARLLERADRPVAVAFPQGCLGEVAPYAAAGDDRRRCISRLPSS